MRPGQTLDPPARLATLAPVEHDAAVVGWEMIEQLDPGVDAERRPALDSGVETAGRVHQERRPGPNHLVTCRDTVDDRAGHAKGLSRSGELGCSSDLRF